MSRSARRLESIQPFRVMEILARARAMEAEGRSVIHMEIGEPDFPTPQPIVDVGVNALREGKTHYTPALGLPALRQAIAASYGDAPNIDSDRIAITPGASGALQLVFGVIVGPGDEVLMADPGYPCNRHMVRLFEGKTVSVPVGPENAFQLTLEKVKQYWSDKTRAVLIASPSNPTGTLVADAEMKAIAEFVQQRDGVLIVDEIYRGLVYEQLPASALNWPGDVFVVNSFSKYYGMTGWRLGWLVSPPGYVDAVERLAQNIFIAAATPAQHAALAAFDADTEQELQRRRKVFQQRRDYLLPALQSIGFDIAGTPQGAFYIYADCSRFTDDSLAFTYDLLERAGVAITPGIDFGAHNAARYVRFSYANELEQLKEGVRRIADYIAAKA